MCRSNRNVMPAAVALSGCLVLTLFAASLDREREAVDKWIETRRLISEEQQDWRSARQMLEGRIDLMERQTAAYREKTAKAKASVGEVDENLAAMEAREEALKEATAGLRDRLADQERRVLAVLQKAPAPVRERLRPLSQRIPEESGEADGSLSARFQNVIGILNELNKFSRAITVASEVRSLPDGANAEVSVVYLGLSQAYYCNLKGGIAGVGRPAASGWNWEPRNDVAQQVADVIAVYRNERPAVYIPLPAEVE